MAAFTVIFLQFFQISSIASYYVSVIKPNLCGSVALSCPEKENKNDQKCKKKKASVLTEIEEIQAEVGE